MVTRQSVVIEIKRPVKVQGAKTLKTVFIKKESHRRLGVRWIERIRTGSCIKDVQVLMDKLNVSQQRTLLENNTNHILNCISRHIASMSREEITTLCSLVLRLHLEYCAQVCDN